MKTWMGIGFENDAAELHRHTKPTGTDADSKSYSKRAVQPKTGNSFRLQVPIFHDVFQCKNFLPPGISLTVTFTRMKDGFYLMKTSLILHVYFELGLMVFPVFLCSVVCFVVLSRCAAPCTPDIATGRC